MKTLTQLKRDAKSGNLYVEMINRFGDTNIPDRLKGKRRVVDANSVGISIMTEENKKSELSIRAASLIEYSDEYLTIYEPGSRELTPEEKAIMAKWEEQRDLRQEDIDLPTDGSASYWSQKRFFVDAGYEYLLGHETKQGKKYDSKTGRVIDNKIKGNIALQYRIVSC